MPVEGGRILARAKAGGSAMPVDRLAGVRLRPVCCRAPTSDDVRCLTDWRNQNTEAFLAYFPATAERTARWLREQVGPDGGRVVFMIEHDSRIIGYAGLTGIDWPAGSFELDGIVRGRPGTPGLMSAAVSTLLDWATGSLGLTYPTVRVRSDNAHALQFYGRLGFIEVGRVGLRETARDGERLLVPDADAVGELTLVRMVRPESHRFSAPAQ